MKRYIRSSFDPSMPDWLRKKYQKSLRNDLMRHYGLALDKVKFLDHDPGTGNAVPIYLLEVDHGVAAYVPGVNDDSTEFINGRNRRLGSIAKSKLPEMAADIVWIDLDDSEGRFITKERYQDPRYTYRHTPKGQYAGQYRNQVFDRETREYAPGDWSKAGMTPSNERRARDKSGYKIPSPEEMLATYYSKYPEKVKSKIDSVYQRVLEVRDELTSADFNTPSEWSDTDISNAYGQLGRAISAYKQLLYMLNDDGSLRSRYFFEKDSYGEFSNQVREVMYYLDAVEKYLGLK